MKKVLTIGGATKDVFLDQQGADFMSIFKKESESQYMLFKSGDKIEVKDLLYFSGGGATNSAVSFKKQGFNTSCFCKIGDDEDGKFILNDLKNENINTICIKTTTKIQSGISFIINSIHGERTIFAYRGANGYLEKKDIPSDLIQKSDQIYITSLSYDSAKLLPDIVKLAHKNKIPVAINPGISQLAKGTHELKECLKYIDILIMNSDEAKSFLIALVSSDDTYKEIFKSSKNINPLLNQNLGKPNLIQLAPLHENYHFNIRKFFKETLKMGPKIVVITDGENGVYVAHKNTIIFHPSIKTKVKDTLGAGDAFGSGFVGSLLTGKSLEQALKRGILNASSVINLTGAKPGLLNKNQLEKMEKKLKQNLIKKFNLNK